jgi:phage tail protein X
MAQLVYSTIQGDFFDSISYKIFKTEKYSPVIMRNNPAYANVVIFDAGIVLTIPSVSTSSQISEVPWGQLFVTQ